MSLKPLLVGSSVSKSFVLGERWCLIEDPIGDTV